MNPTYNIREYHPDRLLILSFMVLGPSNAESPVRMIPLKIIFWILAERASNEYDMEMIPGPVLENFDFNDFEIDLNISKSMYSNIFCLRSRSNKSTELSQRKIFKKTIFDWPILNFFKKPAFWPAFISALEMRIFQELVMKVINHWFQLQLSQQSQDK